MFKVGDKVRAISDDYVFTTKLARWEGVVEKAGEKEFSAKEISSYGVKVEKGSAFHRLKNKDFKLIEPVGLEGAVKIM